MHQHHGRCDGEQRVGVPFTAATAADRSDDRHQAGPDRARGRRHQCERSERRDSDRSASKAPVACHHACCGADDPAKHREVEAGDREDVRESDLAECILDRPIAVFDIAEDKCDEHGSDRRRSIVWNSGQQSAADAVTQRVAHRQQRPRHRCVHRRGRDASDQGRRLDGDEADDSVKREMRTESLGAGNHRCRKAAEHPGELDPVHRRQVRHRPPHGHAESRAYVRKRSPVAVVCHEHDVSDDGVVSLRRLKMP